MPLVVDVVRRTCTRADIEYRPNKSCILFETTGQRKRLRLYTLQTYCTSELSHTDSPSLTLESVSCLKTLPKHAPWGF
jgi:hypothetical protein